MRFNNIHYIAGIIFLLINISTATAEDSQYVQEEVKQVKIAASMTGDFLKEVFRGEDPQIIPFDIVEIEEVVYDHPAHDIYGLWINERVNPYNVAIRDIGDSIFIDLTGYVHPVEEGVVTSHYGPRRGRFHHGIDLRVRIGQNIYAAFDGRVRVVGFDRHGYGRFVVIRHANGLETLYGHLSRIKVEANEDVKAGDLIGLGGNTGRSTGPHLHFELRYLGNAINPYRLICFVEKKPRMDVYMISPTITYAELIAFRQARYHIVRPGDTLSGIARRYGTTVNRLAQLNNINPNSILRVRQRIRYM